MHPTPGCKHLLSTWGVPNTQIFVPYPSESHQWLLFCMKNNAKHVTVLTKTCHLALPSPLVSPPPSLIALRPPGLPPGLSICHAGLCLRALAPAIPLPGMLFPTIPVLFTPRPQLQRHLLTAQSQTPCHVHTSLYHITFLFYFLRLLGSLVHSQMVSCLWAPCLSLSPTEM